MSSKKSAFVVVPVVNLLAISAIFSFGVEAFPITYLAVTIFHLAFDWRLAALGDIAMAITVIPLLKMICFIQDLPAQDVISGLLLWCVGLTLVSFGYSRWQAPGLELETP